MTKSAFYGWKLLAAFWFIYLINLAFPTYGSSVLNAAMLTDLHLTRQTLGTAFSLYMLMVGLPAPFVAFLVNKLGVRFTLVFGSILVLAGSLAMGLLVHTGWHAVVAFGLIIGFGTCAGGAVPEQTGIGRWFVRRRAMALSLMYSSGGIGGFILPPLLNRMIASAGGNWRVGWWLLVALSALAAAIAFLFVKEKPSDIGQVPDGGAEPERPAGAPPRKRVFITSEEWTFSEAIRSRTFALMLLSSIGISCGFTLIQGHGVVHLKDLGHSPGEAARAMSTLAICTLLGKLLASLGDRIEPRYVWSIAMAAFGLGTILVVNASGAMAIYPFAMLMGFGWGATLVCMMAAPINYFGPKAYPSVIGLWLALQTGIGSLAPIAAGYMFDKYGSYAPVFYAIAGLCFAGSLVLLMATPPKRKAGVIVGAAPLAAEA
jgi:MFS family permease